MNNLLPDIYLGAAATIERSGWTQFCNRDDRGRLCLTEAISEQIECLSDEGWDLLDEACQFASSLIGDGVPASTSGEYRLQVWNDLRAKSAAEVIAKLREAADRAEEAL